MTYFTDTVVQVVGDSSLSSDEKAQMLRSVQSQARDLLRAAGPAEKTERERDVDEIDEALAILFPSQGGAPNDG